jgi:hypothetical protein
MKNDAAIEIKAEINLLHFLFVSGFQKQLWVLHWIGERVTFQVKF